MIYQHNVFTVLKSVLMFIFHQEILSMNTVLSFLLQSSGLLVDDKKLDLAMNCTTDQWRPFIDDVRGMIVTKPGLVCSQFVEL